MSLLDCTHHPAIRDDDHSHRCGLYRTTRPLGSAIVAEQLVMLHNHGQLGITVHHADTWEHNKVILSRQGTPVPDEAWLRSLIALPAEGFYRVATAFDCCEKQCTRFNLGELVQLGYNGAGGPILFRPRWDARGITLPTVGTRVRDHSLLDNLEPLALSYHSQTDETMVTSRPGLKMKLQNLRLSRTPWDGGVN